MANLKIAKNNFVKLVSDDSGDEIVQEILNQIQKADICQLNEKDIKKMYAKLLSSNLSFSITDIIHRSTETKIRELLTEANEKQDVSIRFSEGVFINGKFTPQREKRNNLTGEMVICPSYIKPKVVFSKGFIKKINNY